MSHRVSLSISARLLSRNSPVVARRKFSRPPEGVRTQREDTRLLAADDPSRGALVPEGGTLLLPPFWNRRPFKSVHVMSHLGQVTKLKPGLSSSPWYTTSSLGGTPTQAVLRRRVTEVMQALIG